MDGRNRKMAYGWLGRLPAWTLTVVVVALILWLTLGRPPQPKNLDSIPNLDKLVHAIMFGALFGTIVLDWYRRRPDIVPRPFSIVFSAAFAWSALAGAFIELIQPRFGRSYDLWDFMADVAGILIAWCILNPILKFIKNRF